MNRISLLGVVCATAVFSLAGCAAGRRIASHPDLDSPSPPLQFLHMDLALRLSEADIAAGRLHGSVTHRFRPTPAAGGAPVERVTLNAVDLDIHRVIDADGGAALPYRYDGRKLHIELPRPLAVDQAAAVRVDYTAHERQDILTFVRPDEDHPHRPTVMYTMSEALKARYWTPCWDWPNARWSSDISITVPRPYVGVSVGAPLGEPIERADGARTFRWRLAAPVDPHLLGVAIGEFEVLESRWRAVPIRAYIQPGMEREARWSFRHAGDILEYYATLLHTDYPFRHFAHVMVQDHFHGGMEHAGFNMIAPRLLTTGPRGHVPDERAQYNYVAHMLAHAWFAGVTSYANVREAWLNESFATYLHELWRTQTHGAEMLPHRLSQLARMIARYDVVGDSQGMIPKRLATTDAVYQYDAGKIYWKGAWTLHMLRSELGDDLFWRCVAAYLARFRGRAVTTDDLRASFENTSGRPLRRFFDQWVRRGGVPHLSVALEWDDRRRVATVRAVQTQRIDAASPAFELPIELWFRVGSDWTRRRLRMTSREQAFDIALESEPDGFCFDPRATLLAVAEVCKPLAMWRVQAEHGPTALARERALNYLRRQKDADAVEVCRRCARDDGLHFTARAAAVAALAELAPQDCVEDLAAVASAPQARSEIVVAVLEALGRMNRSPTAAEVVRRFCGEDREITVRAAALRALGEFDAAVAPPDRVTTLVAAALPPTSGYVRAAALRALGGLPATTWFSPLAESIRPDGDDDLNLRLATVRLIGEAARSQASLRPHAAELLRRMRAADRRPSVREAIHEALKQLDEKGRAAAA